MNDNEKTAYTCVCVCVCVCVGVCVCVCVYIYIYIILEGINYMLPLIFIFIKFTVS